MDGHRTSSTRERITRSIRQLPVDVVATIAFVLSVAAGHSASVLSATVVRPIVGLIYLFFAPGYALVAAVFPTNGDRVDGADRVETAFGLSGGIDWIERIALSFGVSVAVVPVVSVAVTVAGFGVSTVLPVVGAVAVVASLIALVRRLRLPADAHLRPPSWLESAAVRGRNGWLQRLTGLLLLTAIVVASSSLAYALVVPNSGEQYSTMYLATENGTGEAVAADFPGNVTAGESREFVAGIENREGRSVSYTVVAELQRVRTENDTSRVVERQEVSRFEETVGSGETQEVAHEVRPTLTGDDLRLQYYLYAGSAPDDPGRETAETTVYVWLDVSS